jgi:hypothetical protein
MRARFNHLVVFGAAAVCAVLLFSYGMSYPLALRLRGDAYVYLVIANSFDSLLAAFAFLDDRTVGMPLFDFAVARVMRPFVGTDQPQPWVDAICFALLAMHLGCAWLFAGWMRQARFLQTETARQVLFFFLATFPAMVGHTTTPLTDTLAIDLILWACVLLARAMAASRLTITLAFALPAGLLLGFSILVRSGSLIGVAAGLLAAALLCLQGERRMKMALATAATGCVLVLSPWWTHCLRDHGRLCLQYPSFVAVQSAQAGLRGARTVWSKPVTAKDEIPTLADPLMMENYGARCELTTIAGVGTSSLTGCLLSRPLTIPVFVVKKWIGLFDHFRFTPYVETATPLWLRWLSRAYDSLAWVGLALSLALAVRAVQGLNKANAAPLAAGHAAEVLLVVYSAVMLLIHTALHVEDRYSFPLVPLCAAVLVASTERGVATLRQSGLRAVARPVAFCVLAIAIFLAQVVSWDMTPFRAGS